MKTLLILLALVSTQAMSSSIVEKEYINKQSTSSNSSIQEELIVQIEHRPNRISRMSRETRKARTVRTVRTIKTKKEKTIRLVRCDRATRNSKVSTLIKKDYLTKFVK
jgi:hypothetical protein